MKFLALSILSFAFAFNSNATTLNIAPPDSTSSIVEKGTAAYLISEGKRMFNEGLYRNALVKFREALTKDKGNPIATYWLGECHLALGNYEKAKNYAEEALVTDPEVFIESGYLLGVCYHRLGELDKAIENYSKTLALVKEPREKELRIKFHIAECERAKEMMKNPINAPITPLNNNVNSAFDEYSPVLDPDGKSLYFVSRRADNKGGGISSGDQRYFSDIYVSKWDEEKKEWGEATNSSDVVRRINTNGFDAVSQISGDGKYMYLTINTEGIPGGKPKTKHSDIYFSKKNNKGGWNSPKPLGKPVNTLFFDAASSITEDGNTLYFISERNGGEGRSDIWKTTKLGKKWAKPVNLGPIINTEGQETTVYVTPNEKYLFFSSTGHEGMGGYDIYVSANVDGQWGDPINLGYPINTVSDETHFVYYPASNKAFYSTFSSASNKGIGARDLFEIDMTNVVLP